MVKLAIAELTFKPQRHPLNKDATFLCEQESLCSDAAAFPMSLIVGLGRRRQTPGRPMESTARQQQQQCPGQAHSRRPGGGSGGGPSGGRGGICPAAHPRSGVKNAVSGGYAPSYLLSTVSAFVLVTLSFWLLPRREHALRRARLCVCRSLRPPRERHKHLHSTK